MEIVVGKFLKDSEVLRLTSKVAKLKQVIKFNEKYYRRVKTIKEEKFEEIETHTQPDIIIKINDDDISKKSKFTSFSSLRAAQKYINIYSTKDRMLKYELNLDGFVVYK